MTSPAVVNTESDKRKFYLTFRDRVDLLLPIRAIDEKWLTRSDRASHEEINFELMGLLKTILYTRAVETLVGGHLGDFDSLGDTHKLSKFFRKVQAGDYDHLFSENTEELENNVMALVEKRAHKVNPLPDEE